MFRWREVPRLPEGGILVNLRHLRHIEREDQDREVHEEDGPEQVKGEEVPPDRDRGQGRHPKGHPHLHLLVLGLY